MAKEPKGARCQLSLTGHALGRNGTGAGTTGREGYGQSGLTVALCDPRVFTLQRPRCRGSGRASFKRLARKHATFAVWNAYVVWTPKAPVFRLIILGVLSSRANRLLDHAKFSKRER
jgi:hypothetical protein